MTFTSCSRVWLACAALLVATILFPDVARAAVSECNGNVEHIRLASIYQRNGSLILTLTEDPNNYECINLVLDDYTFGGGFPKSILQMENGNVGDALVMYNAPDGPFGATVANICLWSDGGLPSSCDPLGNITRQNSQYLYSGKLRASMDWGSGR
jgi:hypothetical protein